MAIEALSERLDSLMLSEDSEEETEEYDELPRPSLSRRPRRLTRGRHVDIRSFLTAGNISYFKVTLANLPLLNAK